MAGEVAIIQNEQEESLAAKCRGLIPGYDGYETSRIVASGSPYAAWHAWNLVTRVLDGTAMFGGVDPESEPGQELVALGAELAPAAAQIQARWTSAAAREARPLG